MTPDEQKRAAAAKALERFILESSDLEKLEEKLAGFNLFEAIGMHSQEIRHSKTLAFFLDPSESHGLGQYFLKKVLKGVTKSSDQMSKVSPIDIDCADFFDADVRREWRDIDLLLICKASKIVIVIENKIYAKEHGPQLTKYYDIVVDNSDWKNFKKLFIFLTTDGHPPENYNDQKYWVPYSHEYVIDELEKSLNAMSNGIGPDQEVLIRHYVELMRRRVLSKGEIPELAQKIYANHKHALDIIFEHKPDIQQLVGTFVEELIMEEQHRLLKVKSSKGLKRFIANNWTFGKDWTMPSGPLSDAGVAFEIEISRDARIIKLVMVVANLPDRSKKEALRTHLAEVNNYKSGNSRQAWPRVWVSNNLDLGAECTENIEDALKKIRKWWDRFLIKNFEKLSNNTNKILTQLNARSDS